MKLGYILLYVPNVNIAVEFYEKAFGLIPEFIHESGQYAQLETGETKLGFAEYTLAESHGFPFAKISLAGISPGFELCFVNDDVNAAYERSIKAGALEISPPKQQPWGQIVAYVRDINGYLIEICTPIG